MASTSVPRAAAVGAPVPPPSLLFVLGAISQYVGSGFAVLLFERVDAAGIAWLRIAAAAIALLIWRRPWRHAWDRDALRATAAFGVALAAMNVTFYLAIARLPLGTAVAIEFCGPVVVAALGSRTRRDWGALALVVAGIGLLADVHLEGEPLGVFFALLAGACWAAYIVLGHRVARDAPPSSLAYAMAFGALAALPFCVGAAGPAFGSATLLAICVAVGLLSSVVPYALEQVAMRRLPRARFALLLALLPATAAVVGAIVLGQVPGVIEAAGIALVVAASSLRTHGGLEAQGDQATSGPAGSYSYRG